MRNLFWLLAGAALTWFVIMKGRALLHRLTPKGVAEQVERKGNEAAASFGDFYATFKTSMAAREAELREELGVPESN
ncbi:hypothetical protein FOJ82_12495 [Tessaracoccus rhinocerotis]|uniref:Uncharacterized protein n=1 Tax=Tessaracoccus rhinocerotis TaxID=1689449 RepID=A0A553JY33_9ACTN|nr:hypothetical protein [Tessaracoccus rhinocerotis]TRY17358.1 hypothetical protein FOJ82_12495 [Tessaracoccus rhinocerotis]